MKKLYKETIFFILSCISIIFSVASFIFFELYIPEYFEYIFHNWNSGFKRIMLKEGCNRELQLFKDENITIYKNYTRDFFNNIIKLPFNGLYEEDDKNIQHFPIVKFKSISYGLVYCFIEGRTYFNLITPNSNNESELFRYNEDYNTRNYKIIDSLKNMIYAESYSSSYFITDSTQYSDVKVSQGIPCADPRYYNLNITFNKSSYYYGRSKCPGGKVNNRYQRISNLEVNLSRLFYLNDWDSSILPEEIKNENLTVYARTYIGIKDHCRNNTYSLNIKNINNQIYSIITWLGYSIIFELGFLLLFLNRYIVKYNKYKYKVKNGYVPPYTNPILLVISILITAIHIKIVISVVEDVYALVSTFYDMSCFDEEVPELIGNNLYYLIFGSLSQILALCVNVILAIKYGIIKGIKYAN